MDLLRDQVQRVQQLGRAVAAAALGALAVADDEADYAAAADGQVLLRQVVVGARRQVGEVHGVDLGALLEPSRDRARVGHVALHAQGQGLQGLVQDEGVGGRRVDAQVAHHLHAGLHDEGDLAVVARVHGAVIALVGLGELGELTGGRPVEIAAVHDDAAHGHRVAVHVLGGGVHDDVGAPLDGTAEGGRGEGVVHHERQARLMRRFGEGLDVQDCESRVGDRLAKDELGIGADGGGDLLLAGARAHKGGLDAQLGEGDGEEVDGAAVDGRGHDAVVAGVAEAGHGDEGRHLAGGREHRRRAALERRDLLLHRRAGRVGDAAVHVVELGVVEELGHRVGGVVVVGRGERDGQAAGLAICRLVAAVDGHGVEMHSGSFRGSPIPFGDYFRDY